MTFHSNRGLCTSAALILYRKPSHGWSESSRQKAYQSSLGSITVATAARVGLKMNETELLIFRNAKAGTPLMVASPTLAIDLPLKAPLGRTEMERYGSPTTLRNT